MSVRSFAVFEDLPSTPVKSEGMALATKAGVAPLGLSVRPSFQENVPRIERCLGSPVTEKENIHPVTGLPTSSQHINKKRKMSASSENGAPCVLATKVLAVAEPLSKVKRPELKQRKASMGSIGRAKGKTTGLARSKSTTDGHRIFGSSSNVVDAPSGSGPILATVAKPRKLSRSLSQPSVLSRGPTLVLASVPEDEDLDNVNEVDEINQAVINSRCRDLTVLPLADVSVAYLQSGASATRDVDVNDEVRIVKEKKSFESGMRDFFSPSSSYSSIPSASSSSSLQSPSSTQHDSGFTVYNDETPSSPKSDSIMGQPIDVKSPAALSTPERMQLYSLFTFTSPSQSPERVQ